MQLMQGRAAQEDGARYEPILRLAAGGMGTVYVGTVRGALGFRQIVAIKKPHPHLLLDPSFRASFVKEARLASLIHHANVVDVRDVEATEDDVSMVMEYVEGASLWELLDVASRGGPEIPPGVAVRIVLDACAGLHAAHELTDEQGQPLNLVHRDISPQNLLVGLDGVTRVADFGVAKFRSTGTNTTLGHLKGKLSYTAPECLQGGPVDRQVDVFAMGVVLWEALTGTRLFRGQHEVETMQRLVEFSPPPVSEAAPALGPALDEVVEMAIAKSKEARFENVLAMASALESSARAAGLVAGHRDVAYLVFASAGAAIEERRRLVRKRLAGEPSVASAVASASSDRVPATTRLRPLEPPGSTMSVQRHSWDLRLPTLEQPTLEHQSLGPLEQDAAVRSDPIAMATIPMTTLRRTPRRIEPDDPASTVARRRWRPWLLVAALVALGCAAAGAVTVVRKGADNRYTPWREPSAASTPSPPPSGDALLPTSSVAPPATPPSFERPVGSPSATHAAAPVGAPRKRPGVQP
jgi:serine/threonine-protein kinase